MKVFKGRSRKKPEFVCPPDGEVVRFFNHRHWGQLPVVRMPVRQNRRVPVLDPQTGKQMYRKSSGKDTAPWIPVFKAESDVEHVERLWLPLSETEAIWQDGFEPSAAELAERARRSRIEQMRDTLAERLVDSGVSLDDIVQRLSGGAPPAAVRVPAAATEEAEDDEEAEDEKPVAKAGRANPFPGFKLAAITPGVWPMPDGSTFKGTRKEAQEELKRLKLEEGGAG